MRYRELLLSCLNGDKTETSPVSAWQHKPKIDQNAEAFAAATLADFARYDFDFVKLTPASTWQSIDQGLEDCRNHDFLGRREIVSHNVTKISQWEDISVCNPWQGFSGRILNAARLLKADLPQHVPLLVTVFNPFFQAVQQGGLALVMRTAEESPQLLEQGLEVLLSNTLRLISEIVNLGVDGIFFVTQHASAELVPEDFYRRWALTGDLMCLDAIAKLPLSMLHLHGSKTYWQLFASVPVVLHCDELNHQDVTQRIDTFAALAGTLPSNSLFVNGSRQTIQQAVIARRALLAHKSFIATPGCALPLAVPVKNIEALVHGARVKI